MGSQYNGATRTRRRKKQEAADCSPVTEEKKDKEDQSRRSIYDNVRKGCVSGGAATQEKKKDAQVAAKPGAAEG